MRVRSIKLIDLCVNDIFCIAQPITFSNISPFDLYLSGSEFIVLKLKKKTKHEYGGDVEYISSMTVSSDGNIIELIKPVQADFGITYIK